MNRSNWKNGKRKNAHVFDGRNNRDNEERKTKEQID